MRIVGPGAEHLGIAPYYFKWEKGISPKSKLKGHQHQGKSPFHRYVKLAKKRFERIETDRREVKQTERSRGECNFSNVRECHIYQTQTQWTTSLFFYYSPVRLYLSHSHTPNVAASDMAKGTRAHTQQLLLLLNWISFTDREQFFVRTLFHSAGHKVEASKRASTECGASANPINHKYI